MRAPGNVWAVVLAAGDGTRLQSLTTNDRRDVVPKQFCSLRGGQSLLGEALRRCEAVASSPDLGYIVPGSADESGIARVEKFVEKPDESWAHKLIEAGALWNAFILTGYVRTFRDLFVMGHSDDVGTPARLLETLQGLPRDARTDSVNSHIAPLNLSMQLEEKRPRLDHDGNARIDWGDSSH